MLHDTTTALLLAAAGLREKAERAARSATELRRTVEDQKKELQRMRRVLQREIGEDIDLDRVCSDPEATGRRTPLR